VVSWQLYDESRFDPKAVSPTGAQGIAQFEPSTWAQYGKGSPFDPAAAFPAYERFMTKLLHDEGGSVFKALEAYNAGEGNLSGGAAYASAILHQAGQSTGAQATPPGNAVDAGLSVNPFSPITSAFGSDLKTLAVRLGWIILGVALIILGLYLMNEKRLRAVVREGATAAMVAK
jgi:hypothetical protein